MIFWILMIVFGFGLISYHNKKGDLHQYGLLTFLGDITSFSIFALILAVMKTPVYDLRTGDYADNEAYGRLIFGLVVFSLFFGIAYCAFRFKRKK